MPIYEYVSEAPDDPDAALLLISAVSGVEVQTDKMWKAAGEFDLPLFFAVNLMDRDRASYSRVVEALQKKYGREVTPLEGGGHLFVMPGALSEDGTLGAKILSELPANPGPSCSAMVTSGQLL